MKFLPSLNTIERSIRMAPVIKDLFAIDEHVPPDSIKEINRLKNALHDKKAEICALREKIEKLEACNEELQEIIENYNEALFNENKEDK
tara:strand:- start:21144 stop:21410 length:267 start_codon:yes stop_codon:yes gene_type:complete